MRRFLITFLLAATCLATQARDIYPLNEGWSFFFTHENSSDNARLVTLPHTWNTGIVGGGSGTGLYLQTMGNYQNSIFVPNEWSSRRLFVKFYGVQQVADLFVNGRHVGEHRGGGTAFTFEITDKVRYGNDNTLAVVVSNTAQNDVLPTSSEMNNYGGIYRPVELIVTESTAISPLYFGSEGVLVHQRSLSKEQIEGEVEVHLTAPHNINTCMLNLEITAPDGYRVISRSLKARIEDEVVMIPFSLEAPRLWSPSTPELYTFTVSIGDADHPTDAVRVRTGFRTIKVTPSGGFTLNGQRINIHGVALYHDNIIAGNAFTTRDYNNDFSLIQDLGANALRSAVMPHAQYLYDKCDSAGMLVWIDLPLLRAPFLGDVAYYATPRFEENGRQQLREIIAQNYNHPAVCMWGLFTTLWMRGDSVVEYLRALNDLAHSMDTTRPTVACSDQDGAINFITDLIVWQQDVGWTRGKTDDVKVWSDQLRKNWQQLCSAVSYGVPGFLGQTAFEAQQQPRANWTPEHRQRAFHEEYARNLCSDSLFWGVWINNMFDFSSARRPYGVNGSGLVTLDRRGFKDVFYLYRTLWNPAQPALYLTDKRRTLRDVEQQQFKVYAHRLPTLLVGSDTVVMREYAPCQYISDSVSMQGKYKILTIEGTLRDSMQITVGNILKQKRPLVLPRKASPQPTK